MPNIYHQFEIKTETKKVFDAITLSSQFENWWPQRCAGTPSLGEHYNFYFGEQYDWHAIISSMVPNESVHYKITVSDEDWQPTSFGFDLSPTQNGTLVNFIHKDWAYENDHFKIASFCWAILLNGLKNYVEKGTIIPFDQRS
jgi:uncharacterized protein YndB with AHSA1/START domain